MVTSDDTTFKYQSFQVNARAGKSECFYQLFDYNTSLSVVWHVCMFIYHLSNVESLLENL